MKSFEQKGKRTYWKLPKLGLKGARVLLCIAVCTFVSLPAAADEHDRLTRKPAPGGDLQPIERPRNVIEEQRDIELQRIPQLEVELTGKDFGSWGREKVIYSPQRLRLSWGKPLTSSRATWRLVKAPFPTNQVLASGSITNTGGELSTFYIDLNGLLPSEPQQAEEVYYIRVFPEGDNLAASSIVVIRHKRQGAPTNFFESLVEHDVSVSLSTEGAHGFDSRALGKFASAWLCALTKVAGPFRGLGESVRLFVDNHGEWVMSVKSKQPGTVAARATCTRWGNFFLADGAKAIGSNASVQSFSLNAPDDGTGGSLPLKPSSCVGLQNTVPLNHRSDTNHPFCYISGVSGLLSSHDERVRIFHQGQQNHMEVGRCEDGTHTGFALCANTATNLSYPSSPQLAHASTNRHSSAGVNLLLTPEIQGFCTIQAIRGRFEADTSVELKIQSGNWRLITTPGSVSGGDKAEVDVSCFHWTHPAHPSEL